MKKMNKVVMMALTGALVLPMMTTSVFAADGTGTTEVQYDNTNSIPDPENPDDPTWSVQIPSSVVFTDGAPVVNIDVELKSVNGGALPAGDVTVTVASTNGYELLLASGNDPVEYVARYGDVNMTDTVTAVGTLNETTTKIEGKATLTGSAAQTGEHSDILTYTITSGI